MADIVNLRLSRKRKRRAKAEATADANRLAHGRTAAEKAATRAEGTLRERRIDGHLRATPRDEDGAS